jgi:polyisoprenoid-binding protein YceI
MKYIPLSVIMLAATFAGGAVHAATYDIDSAHSSANFKIRHMMISNVRGQFSKVTGSIEFDAKNPNASKVNAVIDVNTIDTREEARDKHLKSPDFFDVAKFPSITFKSKTFAPAGAGKYKVTGDLTIHGVTKEVVLDLSDVTPEAKGMRGETRIGGQAATKINRKDFGLTWSKSMDGGGVVVGDEVDITIDLELIKNKKQS